MPLALPPGFERAPAVLALGAELKNTFCLLGQNKAVLSQHMGDLQDALTLTDFERNLALYQQVYQHEPQCIAVDAHPEYHSSRVGRTVSRQWNRPLRYWVKLWACPCIGYHNRCWSMPTVSPSFQTS